MPHFIAPRLTFSDIFSAAVSLILQALDTLSCAAQRCALSLLIRPCSARQLWQVLPSRRRCCCRPC